MFLFFYLPPPSSFCQPNPMRDPMRAVNLMALDYVGAPGLSLLLPPSSLLRPAPSLRLSPSSILNKPLCAAYAALCVPPMRGTRFYLDLDRAPCFETILAHRGLCANPMRGHIHQRK